MKYLRLLEVVFTAALIVTCIHWAFTQKAHLINLARFRLHYFTFVPFLLVVLALCAIAEWHLISQENNSRDQDWQFSLRGLFVALVLSAIWLGLFLSVTLR